MRAAEHARTAARLAVKSGLLFKMTPAGARTLLRAIGSGASDPSAIYRLHAANSPSRPALIWSERREGGERSLTFGELDDRMNRVAAALEERGLRRGARVIVMIRNRPEFLEVQGGAGRAGAAGVSVSWRSTSPELAFVAKNCQARAIVFDADLWPVVEGALALGAGLEPHHCVAVGGRAPGCDGYEDDFLAPAGARPHGARRAARDAAVLIYTSGTTGKPKGAVRKFRRDAVFPFMRFMVETPMRADDVHLVACPLYHSTAFGFLSMSSMLGATGVILDEFKPEAFLSAVQRHRVTTTAVVPTMLHRIMALGPEVLDRYDTRSLRVIFTGGAPLPGALGTAVMDRFGDILFNFYGSTETGLVTLAKPQDLRAAPGCIGKPVPGNEIRLLDDAGREVPPGRVGELYVRNRMLVDGYHDDPSSTASSVRDGFFTVGDLARRDRLGRYYIEGRKRDMIISGGVNVYPAEVEAAIEAHPAVVEVAVVGIGDAEWGERVRAFVVRREPVDEGDLKAWCRERLAGPKMPREFVFLDALPRNPTGKVLKAELRGMS